MYVGGSARDHQQQHDPLGAQGANPAVTSMGGGGRGAANGTAKRSVRSMASSVIVDGDRRQRVDVSCGVSLMLRVEDCADLSRYFPFAGPSCRKYVG